MFAYLVLLFTILPALELAVLIKVGTFIGVGNTLLIIILTGVVGAYLARLQGFLILRKIQADLNQGIMPSEEMVDGLLVLVGGIVLLTPGFITDAIGLMLLFPLTRALIKTLVKAQMKKTMSSSEFYYSRSSTGPDQEDFNPEIRRRRRFDNIEDADFDD